MGKRILFISLVISVYLLLRENILELYYSSILEKVMLNASHEIGFYLLILWWIIIGFYYIQKMWKGVICSKDWITVVFVATVLYSIERSKLSPDYFLPPNKNLKYLDTIYLIFVLELLSNWYSILLIENGLLIRAQISLKKLIKVIWNVEIKNRLTKDRNKSILTPDLPIKDIDQDQFNRKEFILRIANEINASHFDQGYSIGIVGKWANGKSSFLNLIKNEIDSNNRIIIDYRPWLSRDSRSITKNFLDHYKNTLSDYDGNFNNRIGKYYSALIGLNDHWVAKFLKLFFKEYDVENEFARVNELLRKLNRQVVVFIDDLDRLDYREIIEVFKLIRNTANFYNTIFITAFDRSYVSNAVRQLNEYNPREYLDKIFDYEYVLHPFEIKTIIDDLDKFIKDEIDPSLNIPTTGCALLIIPKFVKNYRDLKRFKTSVFFNYTDDAKHLYFPDFFMLELLWSKYPQIIDLLLQYEDLFEPTSLKPDGDLIQFKLDDAMRFIETNEKDSSTSFKFSINDIESIKVLLECLLKNGNNELITPIEFEVPYNSIRKRGWYKSYFRLRITNDLFKQNEFVKKFADLNDNEYYRYIDLLLKENQFSKSVQIFELFNKQFKNLVVSRSSHARAVSTLIKIESSRLPVPRNILSLLFHLEGQLEKIFKDVEELEEAFKKSFGEMEGNSVKSVGGILQSLLRGFLKENFGETNFSISPEVVKNTALKLFSTFLTKATIVNKDVFELFYINYESIDPRTDQVILNPKACEEFRKFIKSDKVKYTSYFNLLPRPYMQPHTEDIYVFEPFTKQIFDGWQNFEKFLSECTDYEHQQELVKYFERYKKNDYRTFDLEKEEVANKDFINMQGKIKR